MEDEENEVLVNVKFTKENEEELKVTLQAKSGITVRTVFENLYSLLENLAPLYDQFPDKPFGGLDGAKKVSK